MLMSGSEEDPYSQIFSSLKHPTRRLLLRTLKDEPPKRFSQLQAELKVDSPTLSYHLDSLRGLVEKRGDYYSLTDLGVAAQNLMGRVEETRKSLSPNRTNLARAGIGLVMVLVLLGWTAFAVGWTVPNDRASITDSVLHGVPESGIFQFDAKPGTQSGFVLGMFFSPPRPGEYAQEVSNGLQFYAVPRPSSSPWEVKVNYATFLFTVTNGSGKVWITGPQASLASLSCGLSCSIEFSPAGGFFFGPAPGSSVRGFWFSEMAGEGNYTFWVQNSGPGVAYGNVTLGASSVVYSRPYFFAGILTIVPGAAYLGLAVYSAMQPMRRGMRLKSLGGGKISAGEAKTMAESTPAAFLKKCKWCGAELPIAAERCYECGKPQR
jgi:DNA-binding transcriptional ArsR family regulator/ribosomal protein L40E